MKRKSLRVVALIVAIVLILSALQRLATVIGVIVKLYLFLSGQLKEGHAFYMLGEIIYWVLHFWAIIALFSYWSRSRKRNVVHVQEESTIID